MKIKRINEENSSNDDNICDPNEAANYKGVFYNDEEERRFYEAGSHFPYKILYNCIDKLVQEQNKPRPTKNTAETSQSSKLTDNFMSKKFKDSRQLVGKIEGLQDETVKAGLSRNPAKFMKAHNSRNTQLVRKHTEIDNKHNDLLKSVDNFKAHSTVVKTTVVPKKTGPSIKMYSVK